MTKGRINPQKSSKNAIPHPLQDSFVGNHLIKLIEIPSERVLEWLRKYHIFNLLRELLRNFPVILYLIYYQNKVSQDIIRKLSGFIHYPIVTGPSSHTESHPNISPYKINSSCERSPDAPPNTPKKLLTF